MSHNDHKPCNGSRMALCAVVLPNGGAFTCYVSPLAYEREASDIGSAVNATCAVIRTVDGTVILAHDTTSAVDVLRARLMLAAHSYPSATDTEHGHAHSEASHVHSVTVPQAYPSNGGQS